MQYDVNYNHITQSINVWTPLKESRMSFLNVWLLFIRLHYRFMRHKAIVNITMIINGALYPTNYFASPLYPFLMFASDRNCKYISFHISRSLCTWAHIVHIRPQSAHVTTTANIAICSSRWIRVMGLMQIAHIESWSNAVGILVYKSYNHRVSCIKHITPCWYVNCIERTDTNFRRNTLLDNYTVAFVALLR